MKDLYKTISSAAEGQFRDRGSKFIAFAFPVSQEEEINQIIAKLKKEYHDARHHCFAWRLGADMERYRTNDDGEPSGSAGRPIYGQIQSMELTEVLVVVIRYFGGTLLGVGGLINAYRSATSEALKQAGVIERKVVTRVTVEFSYPEMNAVMSLIKEFDLRPDNQQFDLKCSLQINIWKRNLDNLLHRFDKIHGCAVSVHEEGKL
jgi:uncharacterized YigZ family protein